MMQRQRLAKGATNALAGRKVTVAAFQFGTQATVEFRVHDPAHRRELDASLSIPQARELLRALQAAVEAAEAIPPAEGPQPGHERPSRRDEDRTDEQARQA